MCTGGPCIRLLPTLTTTIMTDQPGGYFEVFIREYDRAVGVVVTPDSYSERRERPVRIQSEM